MGVAPEGCAVYTRYTVAGEAIEPQAAAPSVDASPGRLEDGGQGWKETRHDPDNAGEEKKRYLEQISSVQ